MAEIQDLNTTDASNTGSAANAGWPENMPPSDVNDAARALSGMIARWYADTNGSIASTGSSSAYILAASRTISAYAQGQVFLFEANHASTGATTINIDSVGVKSIVKNNDVALVANDIEAGQLVMIAYEATADNFQMLSGTGNAALVAGDIGVSVQAFDADTSKLDVAETRSASLNFADNELIRPKIKDYGEALNAIGSIGGGTQDIDLTLGNTVSGTVDTSTTTFTFSNPAPTGVTGSFTLTLTNGGSQTINWPASVDWVGGVAPSLTAAGKDVLVFKTDNEGTLWDGFVVGLDVK